MKDLTLENDEVGDEALMHEVVQQQPQALKRLYDRHNGVLRSIVYHVVHDDADADDVLQDTFMQVWNRASSYSSDKGRPLGWMATMARRRAIDRLRQRRAYREAQDRLEVELSHPSYGTFHDHAAERNVFRENLRDLLDPMLEQIPPAQKEALQMAFLKGMSQRQIAAEANLPLGTVKTRIELGLRKLATILAESRHKIE